MLFFSSCSIVGTCGKKYYLSSGRNPQALVGAVVGGPSERDVWMDDRTNAMTNSVSIDFNSALQSSVAGKIVVDLPVTVSIWADAVSIEDILHFRTTQVGIGYI